MRLDGSGLAGYVQILIHAMDPGLLKTWFERTLVFESHSRAVSGIVAAAMIAMSTFGVWLVLFPVACVVRRAQWTAPTWWFAVLIVANYFVMSCGLALDARAIGQPEELLNRPFPWAYFVVVVWSVAALVAARSSKVPTLSSGYVATFAAIVASGLVGVAVLSVNLQTFPASDGYASYADFNARPTCAVRAAELIRNEARADEVMQDQANDHNLFLTAVAERSAWFVDSAFGGATPIWRERQKLVGPMVHETDPRRVVDFMRAHGIDWYLMHPGSDPVAVPAERFACGGYRLLHLARAG